MSEKNAREGGLSFDLATKLFESVNVIFEDSRIDYGETRFVTVGLVAGRMARSRGLSVNKLVEEMSAQALAAWDTENRFRALAAQGDVSQALAILERLDENDNTTGH